MDTIPKVNYEYRKCKCCRGTGIYFSPWIGENYTMSACPLCENGEVLEVESVEDGEELIEEEE